MMRLFLLCFLSLPALSWAQVHEYSLANGMTVLVKEDHRAPVVVSQVWYKVGAADEPNGKTGVSHVLEHMMFKGTRRFPDGAFSNIIAELGGRDNAFTSRDYTAYYQVLAKEGLTTAMQLESDRMRHLMMRQEDFDKEVEVVKEERRLRTEDKPTALTWEQFNAVAFQNSPYQHPVIGWMDDLDNLTLEETADWYRRYYAPNNATLVVVGDVDPEAVYLAAKRTYGRIQASELPSSKPRQDAPQRGLRELTVKAPTKVPYLLMGFQMPDVTLVDKPDDAYALLVLASVLDGSDSARLSKHLVRGQAVAASAGAGYNPFTRYPGLFLMDAQPVNGVDLDQLRDALLEQIERLRSEPVQSAELQRIKAQVIAEEIYQRDDIQHIATQLGSLQTTGIGWQEFERYAERIQAVSAEQVQAVAKQYLLEDRLTIARLLPNGEAPAVRTFSPPTSH